MESHYGAASAMGTNKIMFLVDIFVIIIFVAIVPVVPASIEVSEFSVIVDDELVL